MTPDQSHDTGSHSGSDPRGVHPVNSQGRKQQGQWALAGGGVPFLSTLIGGLIDGESVRRVVESLGP